ncbi:hypothetical protein [Okeania sp.]|nr:hypothetical protein [Okeania sp.]
MDAGHCLIPLGNLALSQRINSLAHVADNGHTPRYKKPGLWMHTIT